MSGNFSVSNSRQRHLISRDMSFMSHAVKAALNLAIEYGSTRNHKSRNAARYPPVGAIYIRVIDGNVNHSREFMSPAPSDVVQFLYFGAFFRLFLANFVLLILDGDIFSRLVTIFCMSHACDMFFGGYDTPSRGNTTNTTRE
jgi:hypothetical protein